MTNSIIKPTRGLVQPDPADILLADIAVRIQLTPTKHEAAERSFNALGSFVDREGSPLHGLVGRVYAQGSMAIGATIAESNADEEYDIDAMVELNIPPQSDPEVILATLHESVAGTKQAPTKYYGKTVRHSRCVQVRYENNMHVDLTPIIPLAHLPDRTGLISHSKEGEYDKRTKLFANPWALAEHFRSKTPLERDFVEFFNARTAAFDHADMVLIEKADLEDVPDHQKVWEKSRALISLQLIKRWRNMTYLSYPDLRMPPSVLLSYWVAEQAGQTNTPSLIDELIQQVSGFIKRINYAEMSAVDGLVSQANPKCPQDVLTDRWPADRSEQRLFKTELGLFARDLLRLKNEPLGLNDMQKVLNKLFGERPVMGAMDSMLKQQRAATNTTSGGGGRAPVSKSGSIIIGGSGIITPSGADATMPHRFHGGRRK